MRANTHTYDDHKVTEREMTKMLITTVLSVLICLVSLVSLTWAWFSDGVTTNPIPITAAYYTVEVQTFDGTNYTSAAGTGTDKEYTIPVNTTKIKLTAGGTATTGFFLIEANGNKYYTEPVVPGNNKEITVSIPGGTAETITVKIIPAWGDIPNDYNNALPEGGISFAESLTPPSSKSMPRRAPVKEEAVPENEEEIEEIIEEEIEDIPDEEIIEEEIEIPEEEPEEIPETPSEETPAETPTE